MSTLKKKILVAQLCANSKCVKYVADVYQGVMLARGEFKTNVRGKS